MILIDQYTDGHMAQVVEGQDGFTFDSDILFYVSLISIINLFISLN